MPRKMPYNDFVDLIEELQPQIEALGWSLDSFRGLIIKEENGIPSFGMRFNYPAGAEHHDDIQASIWLHRDRRAISHENRGRYRERPDPVNHPVPKGRGWRQRLIDIVMAECKRIGRIEDDELPFDISAMPVREFHRTPDDELRKFVLGVADCQIFTSAHTRGGYDDSLLGMIFMPLAMGALKPDEEFTAMLPEEPESPGDKPRIPPLELPDEPEDWVQAPSFPQEPTNRPEPKDVPQDILNAIEWGEMDPEEAEEYRKGEGAYVERLAKWESTVWTPWKVVCDDLRAKHEHDKAKYKAEHDAWKTKCAHMRAEHKAAHEGIEADIARWEQENRDYRIAKARHDRIMQRAFAHHFQNLGVIWEWMSQAGPRSINGYPIFFSCRLMHRDDWTRAEKAILREQERRESIEL